MKQLQGRVRNGSAFFIDFKSTSSIDYKVVMRRVVGVSSFKAEILRRVLQSAVQKCSDARRPKRMEAKKR